MVEVYYTYIPETLIVKDADQLAPKMPLKRYLKYLKLNDDQAKIQNVVAYFLLLKVLADKDISIKGLDFSFTEVGKPYFKDLYAKFNLSHAAQMVAVAIDSLELGIDVEKIRDVKERQLEHVYSKQEQVVYQDKLLDRDFFCKTWTIKESYTKFTGLGLTQDFNTLTFDLEADINLVDDIYIHTFKIQDFYMSVSSKRKSCQINIVNLDEVINL